MTIEVKINNNNLDPDNENQSLPDLKTIWECNKITRIPSSFKWCCGWCNRLFSQFNKNRALHHCSRINFPSSVGIGTCKAQIPYNYLEQYKKMAKNKIDLMQNKKRAQSDLSYNISSTNERISQELSIQKSKRFKNNTKCCILSTKSRESSKLSDLSEDSLPSPSSLVQTTLSRDKDGWIEIDSTY